MDGIRFVGEIGSYVSVSEFNRKIIAEIISVEDKNYISNKALSKPVDVTLTKFEEAKPNTDSSNAKISEHWYID